MDEYSIKESQYADAKPVPEIVDDQGATIIREEGPVEIVDDQGDTIIREKGPVEVIEPISPSSQIVRQEVEYFDEPREMTYDEIAKFIDSDATDVRIVKNPDKSVTIDQTTKIVGEPFSPIKLDDGDFSDMSISTPQEDNTTARVMDMMETLRPEMTGTYTKIVDNNRVTFDSNGNIVDVIPMEEENDMQPSSKTM